MLDNIDDAATEIEKFLVQKKLEGISFEVILVSREALKNAAVHGWSQIEFRQNCQA